MRQRMVSRSTTTGGTLELEVEVEGTPVPYTPACMTLSNGDPGYPEEGGYAEDITVYLVRKDAEGKTIQLDITEFVSEDDINRFSEELCQAAADAYDDRY